MEDKYSEKAKKIIQENIYCAISTASSQGAPWISPVFFAFDKNYNIYWISNKDARHSKNIRENPLAAIVIFNSQLPEGEGDGVYFETKVEELLDEEEMKRGMKVYNSRSTHEEFQAKSTEELTGDKSWRIYKAIPQKIFALTEGKMINGQYVDERVEIPLEKLIT